MWPKIMKLIVVAETSDLMNMVATRIIMPPTICKNPRIRYVGKKPEIIKKGSYTFQMSAHTKVVSVTHFGVRPNSRINAVKAVRAAIEA